MDSAGDDFTSTAMENHVDSPDSSIQVAEMKAKLTENGDMSNHIDQKNQNGHAPSKESSSKDSKHHSSSSKHSSHHSSSKHGSSSSSKHHSSSSSKHGSSHHSSSSSKHHSSSSSKHRDGSSSSSKHKDGHHSSSSSSKHKDGSSSSSSKHKDGHHSSSSSHKHKDGSSSSSNKHKDGHHSSSKHSSSSHSKDKHSSTSSKHKDHSSSKNAEKPIVEGESSPPKQVKAEPESPTKKEPGSPSKSPTKTSPAKPVKDEPVSDDDVPLSKRIEKTPKSAPKRAHEESDDEDEPLSSRVKKVKKEKEVEKPIKVEKQIANKRKSDPDEFEDEKPLKKKKKVKHQPKQSPQKTTQRGKKKPEETQEVWRWWEEERRDDGQKWNFLEHKGPVFAPDYEPLPSDVKFYYDGKVMHLSPGAEEVATFYARMLDHDYTTRDVFNKNFLKDWRKMMTAEEREKIKDLSKCNFIEIDKHFKLKTEERKSMTKEEKLKIKNTNAEIQAEYGFCTMDGHKEKIGNFRIEPPGLFRGRGDHPKQGMLKRRTMPHDVIINCSKTAVIPEPPKGHKWKEVRHDNKVSWLACWNENVQGQTKYVMLNAASRLKGEKDWQKYETARKLHKCVDKIRHNYMEDWKSKEMRIRQRAVAMYFIDKLALRAGNEKEEGETADTVGCCSLRVEHLKAHEKYEDQENVVEFDFLGKDSIRYYNRMSVEKRVFKNLQLFMDNKQPGDDLFDRLNTTILNKHLHDLMDGLTAKVFRTFNASRTLQEQLNLLTEEEDQVTAKLLSYNRANRAVAVLCNHQRAVPKNFSKQMENLQNKIDAKRDTVRDSKKQLKTAKSDYKAVKSEKNRKVLELKKKAVARLEDQLVKLEVQATDKDENKEIALGTSKLNYLDPRISIAWCKKWEVPIEKIYNKTQRDKFRWAIDMADEDFVF
ncbi:DNA topoisomerase I, mitochondrial-like [Mizuhopecten yessoensis]|uniref:DNA topoisomerase I n=1 Tax=Mizuhopecten yessoensis TaxID=6573 RepID=A0A210R633_MIZYE|nr:DNA topoisomerase I, mitochondrial-like [Mizuhopecten yessoensis]OWF56492.1 DNA topoisomerase 1 [Mizuhopecten yessoensis]